MEKVIKIVEIQEKVYSQGSHVYILIDESNLKYTLFHEWNGQPTQGYSKLLSLPEKGKHQELLVNFKEEQKTFTKDGKTIDYTSRTIQQIELNGAPVSSGSITAQIGMAKDGIKTEDKKWEDINKRKEDNMNWLNAKNNACLLYAHGKTENIEETANMIYRLKLETTPEEHQEEPIEGTKEHPQYDPVEETEQISVKNIPF